MEKQQLQVNMQGQDGLIDNGDQEVESKAKVLERALAMKVAMVGRLEKSWKTDLEKRISEVERKTSLLIRVSQSWRREFLILIYLVWKSILKCGI